MTHPQDAPTPRTDKLLDKLPFVPDVPYIKLCRQLERELAQVRERTIELQNVLDAWQSVFGTSQLSHAQARLETAEDGLKRALAKRGEDTDG